MAFFESNESDPDEYLSRDLIDIRETAEENPLSLRGESTRMTEVIRRGLLSNFHYYPTVEAIFYTLSVATTDTEAKDWFDPILDLVDQHPIAEGKGFESGFREVLLTFRDLVGVYGALDSARPRVVDALLQAYIRLVQLLVYKPSLRVPHALFEQALNVSKRLNDHIEKDKLYQAIALYSTHNSEFETAERYALLAYNDAEFIDDAERIVDAACTLAIVYRFQMRFQKADFYVLKAINRVQSQKPDVRFATVYYENGVYCYRHDKFELSRSYYERALAIFEEYEAVYQIAMTNHALAQNYIYLKDFAKAEALLQLARRSWQQLDNNYDWVNSIFVEGDLELKRGNRLLGIQIMRRAIDEAYSRLPDVYARDLLIEGIKTHIDENS
ncbi:MAG: tetratricopeptide repeat protein [Chloroflexota bacterium]